MTPTCSWTSRPRSARPLSPHRPSVSSWSASSPLTFNQYNAEGRVIVERVKRGVDPQFAMKTLRFLQEGQGRSADGTDLAFSAQSVCVQGDSPNGPEVVKAIRDALVATDLQVTAPWRATGRRRPISVPRPGRESDPPRRDAEWEWTLAKQCDWAWIARRVVPKQG
jgi:hypothetical protein